MIWTYLNKVGLVFLTPRSNFVAWYLSLAANFQRLYIVYIRVFKYFVGKVYFD